MFAALFKRAAGSRRRLPSFASSIGVKRHQQFTVAALSVASPLDERTGSAASVAAALAGLAVVMAAGTVTTKCEKSSELTPASVGAEDFDEVQASHDIEKMPVYTSDQVAENNGEDGKPIWMSYGGVVYDVTKFIANHPGGSEKILTAAGSAIEPFWHIYRQHFASDLPIRLMEHMAIGRLLEKDQDEIEEQMTALQESSEDPYEREPERDSRLIVHSDAPMNAECPGYLLTESYLTPPNLFYIRHHHPVPYLTESQLDNFRLEIDVSAYDQRGRVLTLTLDDLKRLKKTEVTTTLQCSGNRRSGFNDFRRTSGTTWGQGAISTARWGGVRLKDLLQLAGIDDPIHAQEVWGMDHVRFTGLDGMMASIHIEKAANPYGDVIVCYEMNGEPLPRDHGGPLRVIVPGYSAVRNVKWVQRIEVAPTEAEGPWQRGLNYKTLPPGVMDANDVKIEQMPSMTESSLFSGITKLSTDTLSKPIKPGDTILVNATGWAWAGGGRNVVRVDLTSDNGNTWNTATLKEGSTQRFGRAWAWTFWECKDIPCKVAEDGTIELASKAVDMAFNSQPESSDHSWNVRGLGNNSWFKVQEKVC
ncbi:Sulfite oxidase, mitochondrial [Seminavis robusta]|uniref:Sulfite oxidase, mitochondrial n=1 Tax=Seminavis robusta TaxID=568900 RepID=A0A9N8EQG0_9STRA|nr:Sulfite oxidase, mitochondrial [Seminavis robusta]|eukprot:Sro1673_g290200.1 Sulfite oxidase, mitochondrial (589) ;mRNA; f:1373-3231